MRRSVKKLPRHTSEKAERRFWERHDSVDYLDYTQASPATFPNLKSTTRAISVRIPESLLAELKVMAGKRGVPYQSLMKILLVDGIRKERRRA